MVDLVNRKGGSLGRVCGCKMVQKLQVRQALINTASKELFWTALPGVDVFMKERIRQGYFQKAVGDLTRPRVGVRARVGAVTQALE